RKRINRLPQFGFDFTDMLLLESRAAAGKHAVNPPIGADVADHVGPASRLPKLFGARRTRMEDDEGTVDLCCFQELLRFLAGGTGYLQLEDAGSVANPERLEQSQIIIERVRLLEAKFRKLIVDVGTLALII